ncbi:hypothetical protein [Bradyrhizobium sp. WSM4349]
MVLDLSGEHPSRRAAVRSVAAKIGGTPQTLRDWVKKARSTAGSGPAFRLRWPRS